MFIEEILAAMFSKGTLIGFLAGVLRILVAIRAGRFVWLIALTDIVGSTLVGNITYEWVSYSGLENWQVLFITCFSSLNAFVILSIITDPKLVNALFSRWIETKPNKKGK